MLKRPVIFLLLATAVFASFTLGFFTGRNFNASPVQVTNLRASENGSATPLVLQAPQTEHTEAPTSQTEAATEIATETVTGAPAEAATEAVTESETEAVTEAATEETLPPESVDPPVTEPLPSTAPAQTTPPETQAPVKETEPPATEPEPEATEDKNTGLININSASAAELMTLPGIGEVLAARIVEYRTANGPFPSVAALTNVKGIGEKRLAAIIHLITV